ncbi:MAG: MnmC family methyltransferase [Thermostichus sp. DG_1_6_bins_120]
MTDEVKLPLLITGDGSLTFFSTEFGQAFHNLSGAAQEALEKFVRPCRLEQLVLERDPSHPIHILDICFGLGYNSGVALETLWQIRPGFPVQVIGLERSPQVPQQAWQAGVGSTWSFCREWQQFIEQGSWQSERWQGQLLWGDARQTLLQVPLAWADAVFLDPFSPSACPELWTVEFLQAVAERMRPQGYLATYSCAASVRAALLEAGLRLGSTPPLGRPWPGTVASPQGEDLPPLSQMEGEHLKTRAAVPYRDPTLCGERSQIRLRRQQEQQRSSLEPTSAWKRRWQQLQVVHPESSSS